jgi:pilus assembly protein CpaB
LVSVVVALKELPRGKVLTPENASAYIGERRVPERFAPPDSPGSISETLGKRTVTSIPAGSYVGMAQLAAPGRTRASTLPRRAGDGRRIIEIAVSGAGTLALGPGSRVDVLVTSERGPGSPRTYLALQGIELVDFRASVDGAPVEGSRTREADATATLRVTLPQAVQLTAAENFARELRLVPREQGDTRRLPLTAVTAQDLHP